MTDDTPDAGSPPPPSERPSELNVPRLVDLMTVGFGAAICIVGSGAIGYGLDSLAGTEPWLTFAGLAFGIVSAVLYTLAKVRRYL